MPHYKSRNTTRICLFTCLLVLYLLTITLSSCNQKEQDLSPIDCVRSMLEAKKDNDVQTYNEMFYYTADEKDLGVIDLTIKHIEESDEDTQWFINNYTDSELAKSRDWTDDFISGVVAVKAFFTVDYDNTVVPHNEGDISQVFYVVKDPDTGLWKILECQSPR